MLDEASAFLALFAKSGWASCHARTRSLEIFVARTRGQPNPMATRSGAAAPSQAANAILHAPHLGTVVSLAAVGEAITAGGIYAVLDLLGERVELKAERSGTVAERLASLGALVEFDQPLIALG